MDTNNWRPTQGTEPPMDTSDWRAQLQPDSRQRIVNKIMETLKRHLPISGEEGLHELRKIAQRFEEKIYTAATSQPDYLRKISLKMLTMENKSQNNMNNPVPSNQGGPSNQPPDAGFMQPQVQNPGQSHPMPMPHQPQSRQQILPQNNIVPQSNLSSAATIGQTSMQSLGQNSNMQNMPGQNLVGTTVSQNSNLQNMFTSSQTQMPGRQQVVGQQQPQNPQQYLYQQQQLLKHKLPHAHSLMQMQQPQQQQQQLQPQQQQPQPQQNLLQPNQLQSNQQSVMQTSSVMQPSMMQTPLPGLQQNQQSNNVQSSTQSMLQQHPQSVMRQQQNSVVHQQQAPISQQPILPSQQQQQLMGQQSNATNLQHSLLLGQQGGVGDMQQQQRLIGQQNNITNLQQHQQPQQLINYQNSLSNMHQQLASNFPGLQQQQLLGPHSGNSGLQTTQHSAHMLQQPKVPMQQQSQQNTSKLLPSQVQQQQPQASQQQMMSQIQSHPAQMQQQLGLQQQPNSLPRDMQQRLQSSGPLVQQQNVLDQQKQLFQSQRALPETSSTSLDSTAQTGQSSGGDWREEVYQRIKIMKETYLPELNEMYQKIAVKLQQHESLLQQPKTEQLNRLKLFKTMVERIIAFLQVPKSNIVPGMKEKLGLYEKQISNFISSNRPRKPLQPGQLPPPSMHSVSQPQSQLALVQSHENQMNSQLQPTNIQGSVTAIPQNNMSSLQHNSMSGVSTAQQSMMNPMQPGASLDSGQGSHLDSLQQVPASSLQQNTVSAPQQSNISSQAGVNVTQSNLNSLQSSSSMLHHPQLKQKQANHALSEEIREINQRLIDTVVDISDEDVDPTAAAVSGGAEGTVVKCPNSAVALSPSLKSQYASVQMSPIQPLWLLVPANYPNGSPKLLDKFLVESCKEREDLSAKVKSRFGISLRSLLHAFSLCFLTLCCFLYLVFWAT
ncbi:mediator of RNA polymerase II transcription subunit 15a [Neltuma alba]|uniref:mediator of RNA polymerase II transcription subunit 15a n=1 Tax=Neltuma alba TaxID=207710 RepID=UPI0010A3A8B3|nr:mediator of RNA polymerase II transcription subunit 15a-like [Prosopis alba]